MSTDNGVSEKERYQRYLAGREWGLLKQQVKARSGGICERCKINPSDAVHHLTYERKYNELTEDLQDICEACHNFTHGKSDEDPKGQWFRAAISGFFKSRCRLFVFFEIEDPEGMSMPEHEVYMEAFDWACESLVGGLMGSPWDSKRSIALHNLLGRVVYLTFTETNVYKRTINRLMLANDDDQDFPENQLRKTFAISSGVYLGWSLR